MGENHKPADIAKAAVEHASKNDQNVVILDTAGRLHIDEDMMNELVEIKDLDLQKSYEKIRDIYGKEANPMIDERLKEDCLKIAKKYWRGAKIEQFDALSPEYSIKIQPQQTTAPDCTHPGQAAVTCQVCGDVSRPISEFCISGDRLVNNPSISFRERSEFLSESSCAILTLMADSGCAFRYFILASLIASLFSVTSLARSIAFAKSFVL